MSMVGANSDELQLVAKRLLEAAEELENHAASIGRTLRSVEWIGAAASGFEDAWSSTHSVRLRRMADAAREASQRLITAAEQQIAASSDNGGSAGFTRPTAPNVDAELEAVRAALDPGGWGVTLSDMDKILATFASLSPEEQNALIAQLTDEELERLFDQMQESRLKGGISHDDQERFINSLLPNLDADQAARFAEHSEYMHPDIQSKERQDGYQYQRIDGELFTTGTGETVMIRHTDASQGSVRDCYLVTAMGATAAADPDTIREMVHDNGNGTYTVTIHDDGKAYEVTVTREVPMKGTDPAYASSDSLADGTAELWPLLVEKAWAQHEGSYDAIEGGNAGKVFEMMTGEPSTYYSSGQIPPTDTLQAQFDAGHPIALSSHSGKGTYGEFGLSKGHAYMVVGFEENGDVIVRNPWGTRSEHYFTFSREELQANFRELQIGA